jgi:hypothetical protein
LFELLVFPSDAGKVGGFSEAPEDLLEPSIPGFGEGSGPVSADDFILYSQDPLDLESQGWQDVTHLGMRERSTSREFVNPATGVRVRYDEGNPKKSGYASIDHYHIYNSNSTGRHDRYLDANGNPVGKGSDASHIFPEQMSTDF